MERSDFLNLLNQWQETQTLCEKILGCRMQTMDQNGEGLAEKGEFCHLCQMLLSKNEGFIRCLSSYKEACFSTSREKPFIFSCHLGLINLAFPVLTEEEPIACLILGPVLPKEKKEQILAQTEELGLDQEKVGKALSSLKEIEEDELPAIFSLLKLSLSSLSQRISTHLQLFLKAKDIAKKEEILRIDEITKLHSRPYLVKRIGEEMSSARRRKYPLSLLVFCLDQFQQIIDKDGLKIEEPLLKEVAGILLEFTRKEDVLARGFEDQFFLLSPDLDQERALLLSSRIDGQIKNQIFCQSLGPRIRLTISCGIAQLEDENDPNEFLEKAEKALFSVKAKGGGNTLLHSKLMDEEPKRCVITGIGPVTANGIGKDNFWKALCAGTAGVGRITRFDATDMPVKIAAEVKDFDPLKFMDRKVVKRSDLATQFAITSARLAIEDSKINLEKEDREKIQVIIGAGAGGLSFAEQQVLTFLQSGPEKISPYLSLITFSGALSSMVSLELGIKGPSITVATGCPAGTDALGYGFEAIRKGETELVVAGGAEAPLRPIIVHSFYAMRALSLRNDEPERASRPFDRKRDGFVVGEGASMVILEELNHAKKRGATIYGEILSYSSTNDAYHMTAPAPDGNAAVQCFNLALEEAKIRPEDIDYINPHGSSTLLNDKTETFVIKKVFGDYAYKIPISSTKSMLGHSIGATGAVEAVVCALSITNNFIPPTINYEFPDPECDLDYVPNKGREKEVNIAFTNSFGFGGKNSALVIGRYED